MPTTFLHLIFILLFLRLSFAALEGKLNGAEFINFARAWNDTAAFGMLHPGVQAHRPDLLSMQSGQPKEFLSLGHLHTLLRPGMISKLLLLWPPARLTLVS